MQRGIWCDGLCEMGFFEITQMKVNRYRKGRIYEKQNISNFVMRGHGIIFGCMRQNKQRCEKQ